MRVTINDIKARIDSTMSGLVTDKKRSATATMDDSPLPGKTITTPPLKYELHAHKGARIDIKETDYRAGRGKSQFYEPLVIIRVNPRKIRSERQLEALLQEIYSSLGV